MLLLNFKENVLKTSARGMTDASYSVHLLINGGVIAAVPAGKLPVSA